MNPEVMLGLLKEPEREKDSHRQSQTQAHLQIAVIYAGWSYKTKVSLQDNCDRED